MKKENKGRESKNAKRKEVKGQRGAREGRGEGFDTTKVKSVKMKEETMRTENNRRNDGKEKSKIFKFRENVEQAMEEE